MEWDETRKGRAIHETIKPLNDDDTLELFNATQPSPSLVQVRQSTAAVARRATDAQDAQDFAVESEVNLLS